jgi:hypothetical protein
MIRFSLLLSKYNPTSFSCYSGIIATTNLTFFHPDLVKMDFMSFMPMELMDNIG